MTSTRKMIAITGTPAVGKTTVSRLLAKTIGGAQVDLGRAVEQRGLTFGFDSERGTLIADTRRLSEFVIARAQKENRPVIVNGHLAPDVAPKRMLRMAFVLRCSPDVLKTRMRRRGYGEEKIRENLTAEALDVCLLEAISAYGRGKVHEIDCTRKAPREVVDEIVNVLEGRRKPVVGRIDWLAQLERQGRTSLLA